MLRVNKNFFRFIFKMDFKHLKNIGQKHLLLILLL